MIELSHPFWVGFLGMAVGTVAFVWGGVSADEEHRTYYGLLASISLIAAVAYLLMAVEIGWVDVDGRTVFIPRYIDWILTTPLLLVFLGMLAGIDRGTHVRVVAVNTVVMVAGFAGALLPGLERIALFAFASVAYLGLLYLVVGPMTERARDRADARRSLFTSLRNLTVVLWTVYPAIWLLGPPGVALLTPTIDVILVSYLDVLTKVGFGLIALNAGAVIETEPGPSIAAETGQPS